MKLSLELFNGTLIEINSTHVEQLLSTLLGIPIVPQSEQQGPILVNNNKFHLKVYGTRLDDSYLELVTSALEEAYKAANPGKGNRKWKCFLLPAAHGNEYIIADLVNNPDFHVIIRYSQDIFESEDK